MAADLLRDGILREIETTRLTGDAALDLFRGAAGELATLAGHWHDPTQTFSAALGAAMRGGIPAAHARGILIAAFDGVDYGQIGCDILTDRPRLKPAAPFTFNTGPDDVQPTRPPANVLPAGVPVAPIGVIEPSDPLRGKVNRALALAVDANAKLAELERLAIDASKNIDDGDLDHSHALDTLIEAAGVHGLVERYGKRDVEHICLMGLKGQSATVKRQNGHALSDRLALELRLDVRRMSDVESKKTDWLWQNRIAIGKQTLIGGEPGLGKSQLMAAFAAAVTTGGDRPCGEGCAPLGSVVILSAEDDAADTIRPRLDAAGADASRVYQISAVEERDGRGRRVFNLQADLPLLERTIQSVGDVRLVIIDPVSSYMGKTNSHKNADVRGTLEPLGDMAARLRVAVVSITHFSKGKGNTALNSFIGSIAFVAAARAAFIVTRDPDSDDTARRLFITAKNNLAADSGGLAFRIEQRLLTDEILASAIVWDGARINRTADEILAAVADVKAGSPSRADAEDFLRDALAGGPVPMKDIETDAKGAGIAWRTVRRAQKASASGQNARRNPATDWQGRPVVLDTPRWGKRLRWPTVSLRWPRFRRDRLREFWPP